MAPRWPQDGAIVATETTWEKAHKSPREPMISPGQTQERTGEAHAPRPTRGLHGSQPQLSIHCKYDVRGLLGSQLRIVTSASVLARAAPTFCECYVMYSCIHVVAAHWRGESYTSWHCIRFCQLSLGFYNGFVKWLLIPAFDLSIGFGSCI